MTESSKNSKKWLHRHIITVFAIFSVAVIAAFAFAHDGDDEKSSDASPTPPTGMPAHPDNPTAGPIGQAGSTETTALPSAGGIAQFFAALQTAHTKAVAGFATVEPILRNSCYDCHSKHTVYPWYHKLPIIKGMMDKDIKHGRHHLDMSNGFPFDSVDSQVEALKEIRHEVGEGDMPLFSYRLTHWGALIEGARQDTLFAWIDSSLSALTQVYRDFNYPVPGEEENAGAEGEEGENDKDDEEAEDKEGGH